MTRILKQSALAATRAHSKPPVINFRFSDYRKPKIKKPPAPPVYDRSLMSWPLKITYRQANKEVVANARAEQLNTVLTILAEKIKDTTIDATILLELTNRFTELQLQYQRLQERFFIGDGRNNRKNRKKNKKPGDVSSLLR